MAIILDIETNVVDDKTFSDTGQLSVTDIIVAYAYDTVSAQAVGAVGDAVDDMKYSLENDLVVGHNFIRFDAPVLERIAGIKCSKVFDTLIAAKILWPKRDSYSLDSFAKELGFVKPPLGDSVAEKMTRCQEDVRITNALYNRIQIAMQEQKIPEQVFKLEFKVAEIITRQHARGIVFDREKALDLLATIDDRMEGIQEKLRHEIEAVPIPESRLRHPPKLQFKKDGTPSAVVERYILESGYHITCTLDGWGCFNDYRTVSLPITQPLVTHQVLDLNAQDSLKQWLLEKGWKPTIWNRKMQEGKWVRTSPKLYDENKELCTNLVQMNVPHVGEIAEYLTLNNRRNVLLSRKKNTGWLNNTRVINEGIICPDADTLGAATGRFTHRIVANVPRVTSVLGKEMRALFRAREGMVMVGWDATALEACIEAHYTYRYDGGEYAREIMQGDIHTKNQESVGLPNRDAAKKFKYAITYGARPKKLSATFGWSIEEATEKYDAFWAANPALARLVGDVQKAAKARGYLKGLDGRRIKVEAMHAALNRLFQSGGIIVMKYAMVLADRMIQEEGLTAYGLIRYHDEEQWESDPICAERVGQLGVKSIELAGKYLKLNVPLRGDYKIGPNWASTH